MHPAQAILCLGCVVATRETETGPHEGNSKSFSTWYGSRLLHAVVGILKVAWEAVKDMLAAKFENDVVGGRKEKAVCGSSERRPTVAFSVRSQRNCTQRGRRSTFQRTL